MKNLFKVFAFALLMLVAVQTADASGGGYASCQTVYGGGEVCPPSTSIAVDKLVQTKTKGGTFVDNLTLNDPLFKVGENVVFQIKVKNTSTEKISRIDVVDTLPEQLKYVAGPGSYNESNRTLTITVENLDAGKEAVYFVTGMVTNNQGLSCATNTVVATTSKARSEDTASFCMEVTEQVYVKQPVKKVPATGPESVVLFSLPALGAAGFYLRRKTNI